MKKNLTILSRIIFCSFLFLIFVNTNLFAQLVINEGSNRNYSTIKDENAEFPDWIEIYNSGSTTINLLNYSLSDDSLNPAKWTFPNVQLLPGAYKIIFCSGKDRKPISGFKHVLNKTNFNAVTGWNTHLFTTPFYWDGVSNILINTCSYSSTGYTTNSIFNQSTTPYYSTIFAFQDGSPYICEAENGSKVTQRPNMKINGNIIGTGTIQNTNTTYPAPYGNWYWAAKNQMMIRGSELIASGLTAGNFTSLAFDVTATDPATIYDYIDFNMKMVSNTEVTSSFEPVDTNNYLHTNFKLKTVGEKVYLYSPTQVLLSSLFVNCNDLDNSIGSFLDASSNVFLFQTATPGATNNSSTPYNSYLLAPVISVPSGIYTSTLNVSITNPNPGLSTVRYTLDGSDPTIASTLYTGTPINVYYSTIIKAKAFASNILPSQIAVSSYLIGISHVTPVLSIVTDNTNLYGTNGIFDNWQFDWEKAAYVEYFDSTQQKIFSQRAGLQIDGGAGGSRSSPQHSMRVELDHGVLGEGPINYQLIPNRPNRMQYSKFYLRNGSNQYLNFPYKDACEVEAMGDETNNYYSAWRPISVYINGAYFGLYELREKYDLEYFETLEGANPDSTDILSLSYWNGSVLRAIEGSVDSFYTNYSSFESINTSDTAFWTKADHYFDMKYYNDYIIGQSWIADTDWPQNNIKIYRSDKTDYRWRFCLTDLELSLDPYGWTDSNYNHIAYMMSQSASNPYINIWKRGIQNAKFKNYFINRFADVMNTAYGTNHILPKENRFFNQTVVEMPKEYQRWGNANISQQMAGFVSSHQTFQTELSNRTAQVRNHIQSGFSLAGQVDVTLDVLPAGAGKIKISTIIPDSLPWTGVYFNGNPVRLTAIPNTGYEFAYWAPNILMPVQDTNISINLNIPLETYFQAVFTEIQNFGGLSISEVNYHSDSTRNAGDWIEFHKYGNGNVDISGWTFTDSVYLHNYVFPAGTILHPNDYLVLAEDTLKFHTQHPGIQVFGPTGFGFSNSNESMTLKDNYNSIYITMHYDDSLPWPQAVDGIGHTLELLNDTLNPKLASSWFAGCINGSPGGPYVPCNEGIIFSEINYKSSVSADAGDWVELYNKGTASVDISGWKFSDGDDTHTYVFPAGTVLAPSQYLAVISEPLKFNARFPGITNYSGPFVFGLGSTGEALRLFDAAGNLYQSLVYDEVAPWPQGAFGNGFTLELLDLNGKFCEGNYWVDGCPEGSPDSALIYPCETSVNEIAVDLQMKLYPNPSNGKFTIEIADNNWGNANIIIEVSNILGNKIYAKSFSKSNSLIEIDLTNTPKGIYFARIFVKDKSYTSKVIIE
ncbi:MAG: lamin tail domain-containing protein [Bacteroidetes bacterium]|nr:lamin tail domain-containing protein [Bacteroidota bacterium]